MTGDGAGGQDEFHGNDGFALRRGLAPGHRAAAAALYWQAFGGKLGRVMGPEARALGFLERVIRMDHAMSAVAPDGTLLGLVGFKTRDGAFASGAFSDLRAVYGLFGAMWRAAVITLLEREVENERFLVDGLCVAAEARGQGVGTGLIEAICGEARRRGYAEVRLDVVDTNLRARALYERHGFVAHSTSRLGLLSLIFGFSRATAMVRPVG